MLSHSLPVILSTEPLDHVPQREDGPEDKLRVILFGQCFSSIGADVTIGSDTRARLRSDDLAAGYDRLLGPSFTVDTDRWRTSEGELGLVQDSLTMAVENVKGVHWHCRREQYVWLY